MEDVRIVEILSFIDGYAMCAIENKVRDTADNAYILAISKATDKYNVSPIYRSALIKAVAMLTN